MKKRSAAGGMESDLSHADPGETILVGGPRPPSPATSAAGDGTPGHPPHNIDDLTATMWKVAGARDDQAEDAGGGLQTEDQERGVEAPQYEFVRVIGRGGVGEVWEGRQRSLGRLVALKKVRADRARNLADSAADRALTHKQFVQEAATTALLEHPNIVPIHDLGTDASGAPILAMRLVRGESWATILKREWTTKPRADFLARHIAILRDVSRAVAFAHAQGIIHRDIKPAQVMIGEFGEAMVMDWGLAVSVPVQDSARRRQRFLSADEAVLHEIAPAVDTASNPAGTPALMAPEQTVKDPSGLGTWTDVYLLGGTIYYILTGSYPHQGENSLQCMMSASTGAYEPPEERAPHVYMPPDLVELCSRCMHAEPSGRPQDASAVLREIENYLSGANRRQESERLVAKTESLLRENEFLDYETLSLCLSRLGRAETYWPENPSVGSLKECVLVAYTDAALTAGDLRLARMMAEQVPGDSSRDDIMGRVSRAERKAMAVRRQRWLLLGGFTLAVIALAAAMTMARSRVAAQNDALKATVHDLGERVKELTCIYALTDAVRNEATTEAVMQQAAELIPPAWQFPAVAVGRVVMDGAEHRSPGWKHPLYSQQSPITVGGKVRGFVEAGYTAQRPQSAEGPFLAEERRLIDRMAGILGETVVRRETEQQRERAYYLTNERVKELTCIYGVTDLVRTATSFDTLVEGTLALLPPAWQYPDVTVARIVVDGKESRHPGWADPVARQRAPIVVAGTERGYVEVGYTKEMPAEAEGPFFAEERNLIDRVAAVLGESLERSEP